MPPPEYRKFLVARLAEVIAAAWKTRAPGAIRRGFGYAVVGRCRRAIYAGGTGRMYGQTNQDDFLGIESCDDHAVNFLFTLDAAGELSGMVINLACPSQCDENDYEFSADFWHNVREGLAARYGAKVHLLPQCAPAGDASPHLLIDQKEEKDLRDRIGVDDKGIIARRILAATEEALATASAPESTLAMAHEAMVVQLPRIMVTRDQYEMEKRIPQLSEEERKQQPWGFQWLWPFGIVCDLVRRYEQQHTFPLYPAEVHIIRLGDVVFATSPFELFMDYGARIRARSKALQTFVVQLADGSGNGFYLPTARALANGHYSAIIKSNWVGPDGGAQLVGETVHVINNFFATEDYPRTR